MTSTLGSIGIVILMLIALNGIMGGAISDATHDLATSDEKEDMRNSLYCVIGINLWTPTTEIWGVDFPIPSYEDMLISGIITLSILFILDLVNTAHTWKHSILLFVVIWFSVKLTGLFLIKMSGADCELILADMAGAFSGVYAVGALLGVGIFVKAIRAAKG